MSAIIIISSNCKHNRKHGWLTGSRPHGHRVTQKPYYLSVVLTYYCAGLPNPSPKPRNFPLAPYPQISSCPLVHRSEKETKTNASGRASSAPSRDPPTPGRTSEPHSPERAAEPSIRKKSKKFYFAQKERLVMTCLHHDIINDVTMLVL